MIINDKQIMANCLDGLQDAMESLSCLEESSDIEIITETMKWYQQVENIYQEILRRYES